MLLLTRKENQTIWIGDDVEIVITRVDRGKVQIGIRAPKDTVILRGELKDGLKGRANDQAAEPGAGVSQG